MNIGFIGLGIMGGAYAKHLLKNKYPCFGIEPDKKNISRFMNLGGVLTTYSEIFDKVDVILSSLPSLEAYQNVLENIKKYKTNNKKIIILDMNTISIDDKIHFPTHFSMSI